MNAKSTLQLKTKNLINNSSSRKEIEKAYEQSVFHKNKRHAQMNSQTLNSLVRKSTETKVTKQSSILEKNISQKSFKSNLPNPTGEESMQ